jgi:hypothetical protein
MRKKSARNAFEGLVELSTISYGSTHHSTTEDQRVRSHSLVENLYVLLGRRCPLAPQMYRQQAVCEAEGVGFRSKIDLMEHLIRTFEPVAGTLTHVLLDT